MNSFSSSISRNKISGTPSHQLDGSDFKVDSDGGDVRVGEGVVSKPEQQGAFAHARISDEEKLKQVVILAIHGGL